jgi:hypothetical protein
MFRNLLIGVAIFGLGWGASFGAGIAYGKRTAAPAVQAAPIPGQNAGNTGAAGANGGQGGARVTVGTVAGVDGKTLTLTGANNQQVKVNVADQTQINKEAPGTLADLVNGARVAVQAQGQPAADGTITAASIQIVPEGAALGAFGGQQAQRAQQGSNGNQGAQGAQGARGGQGAQQRPAQGGAAG